MSKHSKVQASYYHITIFNTPLYVKIIQKFGSPIHLYTYIGLYAYASSLVCYPLCAL